MTTEPSTANLSADRRSTAARTRRRRWLSVLLAMAAATGVAGILGLAGVDLEVAAGEGTATVGAGAVMLTALGAGLAAWLLLEVLERFTPRSHLVWSVVAVAVLVVSLLGPLAATSASSLTVLVLLHLLVGAVLLAGLGRSARLPTRDGR